jgi:hypothetical protein
MSEANIHKNGLKGRKRPRDHSGARQWKEESLLGEDDCPQVGYLLVEVKNHNTDAPELASVLQLMYPFRPAPRTSGHAPTFEPWKAIRIYFVAFNGDFRRRNPIAYISAIPKTI